MIALHSIITFVESNTQLKPTVYSITGLEVILKKGFLNGIFSMRQKSFNLKVIKCVWGLVWVSSVLKGKIVKFYLLDGNSINKRNLQRKNINWQLQQNESKRNKLVTIETIKNRKFSNTIFKRKFKSGQNFSYNM